MVLQNFYDVYCGLGNKRYNSSKWAKYLPKILCNFYSKYII